MIISLWKTQKKLADLRSGWGHLKAQKPHNNNKKMRKKKKKRFVVIVGVRRERERERERANAKAAKLRNRLLGFIK